MKEKKKVKKLGRDEVTLRIAITEPSDDNPY